MLREERMLDCDHTLCIIPYDWKLNIKYKKYIYINFKRQSTACMNGDACGCDFFPPHLRLLQQRDRIYTLSDMMTPTHLTRWRDKNPPVLHGGG